jgi:hypothetical protein
MPPTIIVPNIEFKEVVGSMTKATDLVCIKKNCEGKAWRERERVSEHTPSIHWHNDNNNNNNNKQTNKQINKCTHVKITAIIGPIFGTAKNKPMETRQMISQRMS